MAVDETRRRTGRRGGTALLSEDDIRSLTVSSRLSRLEVADLDDRRRDLKMARGEYMRAATFGTLPRSIPAINQTAWTQLSRLSANVNQYQAAINNGKARGYPPELLREIVSLIEQLRRDLIGASSVNDGPDGDEDEDDEVVNR